MNTMRFKVGDKTYDKNGKLFGRVHETFPGGVFSVLLDEPIDEIITNAIAVIFYKCDGSINGTTSVLNRYPEIHQIYSENDLNTNKEKTIELYLDDEGDYDE